MSLTVSLALLAVAVLLGLLAQGWWSARKSGPRQPDVAQPQAERQDPTMDAAAPDASAVAADDAGPAFGELRVPPTRRGARLDALIDIIAPLTLEAPVTGEHVLAHLPASRRAGTKPFLIEGLDTETGEWGQPVANARYGEFQAGVQMANRSGALNEIEYSEFAQKVQDFAEAIGAMPELPDMLDAVARARELDGFASAHDAQLAITLRANSVAWSVGYIQQCAARHGFIPGAVAGKLVLPSPDAGEPPLLTLAFDAQAALAEDPHIAAVREVVLWLDVPQSPESAEPFPAWQQSARALCDDMDATAVDDQGAPVTLHAFANIGQELQQLYQTLAARDFTAGSAVARRLFS
ncbi:hypothetical protein BurJ1DRAFT_2042 [Burkholderiales bacterium JOSHI_001]|nr:hypothetical protein BurJ1DRAFT_2042 [Burkholderiales bacterium JOSHI_001]